MGEKKDDLKSTFATARELCKLYVDNFTLLAIEKVSIMMSRALLVLVAGGLALCAFFFISVAVANLLSESMSKMWSYLIMGGVYLLLIVLVFVFRNELITNHITRFLSKLCYNEPKDTADSQHENNANEV